MGGYMRKKIFIVILIIIILVLFVPLKFRLLDGGTVEYKAILYKVSKVNRIINDGNKIGYAKGIEIEILGYNVYSSVKDYMEEEKRAALNEIDEITMSIKDGTLTSKGATLVIVDTSNNKHLFGSWYRIDKKENDEWRELNTIIRDYAFTSIGYSVDDNGKLELEVDWEWLYGELSDGEYRLVKKVDDRYFSVEFMIRQDDIMIYKKIPYGEVITYNDIAKVVAKRKHMKKMSAQAVGGAVGWNPICLIIPCHRVIGTDGSLTGYGGGIENKKALLEHEKNN